MCGIAGAWLEGGLDRAALERALAAMVHRGPDGAGVHVEGPVALGMRRLAIIDPDGGQQPIWNEAGDVAVVCNGELYDYEALLAELERRGHRLGSRSDTEALVHLYEEQREWLCARLRGMFAFAIWDRPRRSLLLGRDRFGKKPLFVARHPRGGVLFASELPALRGLARATGLELRVRDQAIYDYLSLGVVPQPSTIFEGVEALAPGTWLRVSGDGAVSTGTYWTPPRPEPSAASYAETLARTRELVQGAIATRLRADVPIGVFLSGGVDSTIVAAEAARRVGSSLKTFTAVADDPDLDESPVAARTARRLGVDNHPLHVQLRARELVHEAARCFGQPFADPSALPSLAVSRLAREHVTVVLNGDGGDELFAGYRRYVGARITRRLPRVSLLGRWGTGRRRSALGFLRRALRGSGCRPGERYLVWTTDLLLEADKQRLWRGRPCRPTEEWLEDVLPPDADALEAQLVGDLHVNLRSGLLVKMDMASMACSLEARSPFLDHVLADFVLRLPPEVRMRWGRPKALLKDAFRAELPDEVRRGRKRGFEVPIGRWLSGELAGEVHDLLGAPGARVREWIDGATLDSIVRRRALQDRNLDLLVYALLQLELWLQGERP